MVRALGRRLGQDHKHNQSGEGGTTVNPDTLASLDLTTAGSGIPVEPDGSGSLTTGSYPTSNPLGWSEDGNSPGSFSGNASVSVSLNSNHDQVLLVLDNITGSSSSNQNLELTVNGDTNNNYDMVFVSGGNFTNPQMRIGDATPDSHTIGGSVMIAGRWDNDWWFKGPLGGYESGNNATATVGGNQNVTSPLTDITLQWQNGNISGVMNVYGRDLP